MAAEEQEIEWIYLEIDGCKLRIDPDNSNNMQKWFVKSGSQMLKNPYWKQMKLTKHNRGYLSCCINHRNYQHHRVVYYAHNQDWDIYNYSHNNFIDHIDHNTSNNQISNLRAVTSAQNQQNNTAKGYHYNKKLNKWQTSIKVNNKDIHLGCFEAEEEAREAYLKAKREHHPFFHEPSILTK